MKIRPAQANDRDRIRDILIATARFTVMEVLRAEAKHQIVAVVGKTKTRWKIR